MDAVVLVADVGGTWLRAAAQAVGEARPGAWLRRVRRRTPAQRVLPAVLEVLARARPRGARVVGVGLAVAGFVDARQGRVLRAPNIPEWDDVPLAGAVRRALGGARVVVLNDANAAALAEAHWGAGQGFDPVLFVTVSTGVGGGVVVGGRLLAGARGLAGEIGHLTVWPAGPRCSCGQPGHLEAVASGWAIARQAAQGLAAHPDSILHRLRPLTAAAVAQAATQGDAFARTVLEQAGRFLGRALADLSHVFAPGVVVLGGGVTRSGPLWWTAVRAAYRAGLMHFAFAAPLRAAALGDDAGLLGALRAVTQDA